MTFADRRRSPVSVELIQRVALVWLLVCAIYAAVNWPMLAIAQGATLWTIASPFVALGFALSLTGRLAWRMMGDDAIFYACVSLVLSSAVAAHFQPLRPATLSWQIAAMLAALNGLAARDERTGGRIAGAAMGLALLLSPDLWPMACLFGAIAALRWLRDARAAGMCLAYIRTLALLAIAGYVAAGAPVEPNPTCSATPLAQPAGLLMLAAGFSVLGRAATMPPGALALGMAATVAAGLGVVAMLSPACLVMPLAAADPLANQAGGAVLRMIVPPLAGLWAAFHLWQGSTGWLRRFWCEYFAIAMGAFTLSLIWREWSGLAAAVGAVPLGWMLRDWRRRTITARNASQKALLAGMALAIAVPDLPFAAARIVSPAQASGLWPEAAD